MEQMMEYKKARDLLLSVVKPVAKETVFLEEAQGRVLGAPLTALENVPAFDRSPYDGYAFRAADSAMASAEHPVTLRILEEVPAGSVPTSAVQKGEAVKILTGAPIPEGADTVIMYEKTTFTEEQVTLYAPQASGANIVRAGEDVKKGQLLAKEGQIIDAGLSGSLAAQGVLHPVVFRKPLVGILSTGSELVDETGSDAIVPEGKIRNTNRYTLQAALKKDGCETIYLGTAKDRVEEIAALILEGLTEKGCDLILSTGGVSAGDYDLTPAAMEAAGCRVLVKGVKIKPGMACCYAQNGQKPVLGLSGNPSSSILNYYTVVRPAVLKMTGRDPYLPEEIQMSAAQDFGKSAKQERILKGILQIEDGKAVLHLPDSQGNTMIGSLIGCNCLAVVPKGSGPVHKGDELTGFMI